MGSVARTGRSFQKKSGLFLCYIPPVPILLFGSAAAKSQDPAEENDCIGSEGTYYKNCILDTGGVRVVFVMIQGDEGGLCYDTGG